MIVNGIMNRAHIFTTQNSFKSNQESKFPDNTGSDSFEGSGKSNTYIEYMRELKSLEGA
jgi:hypothetical protein